MCQSIISSKPSIRCILGSIKKKKHSHLKLKTCCQNYKQPTMLLLIQVSRDRNANNQTQVKIIYRYLLMSIKTSLQNSFPIRQNKKKKKKKIEASPLRYLHHLFSHVQIPWHFLCHLVAFFSLHDPSLLLSA